MPESPLRILLVSASQMEMLKSGQTTVNSLVAGVGMVNTTYALTRQLMNEEYDLVVNIGIAGSFHSKFSIGSVVQVGTDRLVELGVEDNDRFVPADEMNLIPKQEVHFESSNRVVELPIANGITVNRVHGSADSIQRIRDQFNPDIESMEGAAAAYVCEQFNVPWVQIRAISNMVEPRNREAWNVPLAIKNLHAEVLNYLKSQYEK